MPPLTRELQQCLRFWLRGAYIAYNLHVPRSVRPAVLVLPGKRIFPYLIAQMYSIRGSLATSLLERFERLHDKRYFPTPTLALHVQLTMLPVLRMLPLLYQLAVLTAIFAPVSYASSNGMDMSADGAMPLAQGEMLSYLHFTPGDTLWFMGWVPASAGAMVGTCIGLFLLALVERWIAASRAVMEIHWNKRAHIIQSNRLNGVHLPIITSESKSKTLPLPPTSASQQGRLTTRSFPPFILTHDVTRGILYLAKTAINFAFMLAVMTFQLGFIFAIVVGLGVGEMLFGRYASHAAHLA